MAVCDRNTGKFTFPFFSNIVSCSINSGEIEIGSGSVISKCNHNKGSIKIGDACQIQHVDNNNLNLQIGDYSTIQSINFNSSSVLIGNHVIVSEIKDNSGTIVLGNHCTVRHIENNSGKIIGGHFTVIPMSMSGNCWGGQIKLGEETAIRTSLTRNIQDYNREDKNYGIFSKITSCSNNQGWINVGGGSTITKCDHNHGSIKVGDACKIVTMNYNDSYIEIGDNLETQTIGFNNSEIKIGDNAKIFLIKYNTRTIRLGNNCSVVKVEDNSGNIFGGIGTSVPSNANVLNGRVEVGIDWTSRVTRAPLPPGNGGIPGITNNPFRNDNNSTRVPTSSLGQVNININSYNFGSSVSRTIAGISAVGSSGSTPSRIDLTLDPGQSSTSSQGNPEGPKENPFGEVCAICLENPRNVAFTCGHLCCKECSRQVRICHMCREPIRQKITLYA